jgi:hypothetical protein
MSKFTDTLTYGYVLFDPIVARIWAENDKGITTNPSEPSDSEATARTIPAVMASGSIQRHESTTEKIVMVKWTPLTTPIQTGDSDILSYNLEYDQGSDDWISLIGESSNYQLTEANVTHSIIAGGLYKFRIKARNIYGWATDFSSPAFEVYAAEEPDQMQPVTVEYIYQN